MFTADFETSTDKWLSQDEYTRVWAYAICNIDNPEEIRYGNNIEDFMTICLNGENGTYYFHNLKFDGEYIIYWLLKNDFKPIEDKKNRENKTFCCLINEQGAFYSIEVYLETKKKKVVKCKFLDSMKIFNFSVEKVAKSFNLPISKLKIDYDEYREIGHILTEEEIAYIKNDVKIMALALNELFKMGHTKMTIGSNALYDYKNLNKNFNKYFPQLDLITDNDIRQAYRGGFTYLNPLYKSKSVKNGIVFDVNSLYPSVMRYEYLPYGVPIFFEGQYKEDKLYNLYIQQLSCSFEIKEGYIPTIQIKHNRFYQSNEYLESSNGEIVTITLSSVDLELFFKHYNVKDITYHSGWKFKSVKGLFNEYIDKWLDIKTQSKKDGNSGLYTISKLFLNSLYGKLGLNPRVRAKYPILEDDVVKYRFYDEKFKDSIYIPMAVFITAYARYKTISTSQRIREISKKLYGVDLYVYSDTDSIHCLFDDDKDLKDLIDIDDYKLGAWKWESSFKRAKFIRQKTYVEEEEEGLKICCAGLPKMCYEDVNFDNFEVGFTSNKKLKFNHIKGGVILSNTEFTIKEDVFK